MPVRFTILPDRGLVYVRYDGHVRYDDTMAAFADYARHPDCAPGQKQLVDLSRVTGYEHDFAALMRIQARKAEVFACNETQSLVVYYAPTLRSYEMAQVVLRSWDGLNEVVARVVQAESEALELLGQPESRIAELMARAG